MKTRDEKAALLKLARILGDAVGDLRHMKEQHGGFACEDGEFAMCEEAYGEAFLATWCLRCRCARLLKTLEEAHR